MIFIDKMKSLKIYKKPFYLPTMMKDKKKKSVIYLLTPNYASSQSFLNNPLTVNKLRFQSYYLPNDVMYYIKGKTAKAYEEDEYVREATVEEIYQGLYEMTAKERNRLDDSEFGLPSKRKYPLDSEAHVRSAIRFFNYVDKEDEVELAGNIKKAMKKYGITDITIGKKNRFYKYYYGEDVKESVIIEDDKDTVTDAFTSFIAFSGYCKDIAEISNILNPQFYYEMTENLCLEINSIEDLPILMINVGTNESDTTDYEQGDRKLFRISIESNSYVKKSAYIQIINQLCPQFEGTILANLLTEHVLGLTSFNAEYINYIFDNKNISVKEYMQMNEMSILNILREKFDVVSDSLQDKSIIQETDNFYTPFKEEFGDIDSGLFTDEAIEEAGGIRIDDTVYFFNEAKADDTNLKRMLYNDRIRKRTEMLELLKKVKNENLGIKYAFPDLPKYQSKNIFYDLYYYNEAFFKNNTLPAKKAYAAYLILLERFLNHPELKANGYEKKTIFIPILDWSHNRKTRMWMYRENLNPISVIYNLIMTDPNKLKKLFGDIDLIFFDKDKYFKLNFSELEDKDLKRNTMRFKLFIMKIMNNEEFEADDVDTSMDFAQNARVIKTNIIDDIDIAKGVDLTSRVADMDEVNKIKFEVPMRGKSVSAKSVAQKMTKDEKKIEKLDNVKTALKNDVKEKDTTIAKTTDIKKLEDQEKNLNNIAKKISIVGDYSNSTDQAYNDLNDDREFKELLADINSISSNDNKVDISPARASRMNDLDRKFVDSKVKDKTVKELLNVNEGEKDIPTTSLKIASPNKEWSNMKYMNFDKDYDLDADIIKAFHHFTKVTRPVVIKKITAEDISTSEDALIKYTAECEDYRGKRFTIKLDVPKMIDNRMLLRGNQKCIQNQLVNIPIIKTDSDTCQIVSNYQKIFIYVFNNSTAGRSNNVSAAIIKSLDKCGDKDIKITSGQNIRVSNKYELPVDYVDLSSIYSTIETKNYIFYFNQDTIRELYPEINTMDESAIAFGYDKRSKQVMYYRMQAYNTAQTFSQYLRDFLCDESAKFKESYDMVKWSISGTYSRCKLYHAYIPLVLVCAYLEGLSSVLKKAQIPFEITEKLNKEDRNYLDKLCIKFKDGYLLTPSTYEANMLLNGLKECSTELYSIMDIDNKAIYYEMLDDFGGKSRAEGLDNFYDCIVDPITKEVLEHYGLPTDFISILLYANALLCDNKFIRHVDTSSRRIRRAEQIAAYVYQALAKGYGEYSMAIKHGREAVISIKETAVIDMIMSSQISSDDTTMNALGAVETTNAVTFKGIAGLNSERSYSLDKRVYDSSMINVLGMSTGFSANVGMTRQTSMDMNVEDNRGYITQINGDTSQMNAAKTLCATEAMTPFGSSRDDNMRTNMTFIQTAKHSMRTIESDPLLVTNGADEALAYLTLDKFAFKAKGDGTVKEVTDDYIIIEYKDGGKDFVDLKSKVEKNSAGGFYVPLKLDKAAGINVGSKVSAGTILAYDKTSFSNSLGESDNIAYNIGKLAKVAVLSTDDGFEDSGFCTDRLSKEMSTKVIMKEEHVIDKECNVFYIANVGDHVEPEDNLLVWQTAFDDEESIALSRNLSKNIIDDSELGKKTIKSSISGTIVDIKMYRTVDLNELSPSLQKIVKKYESNINELKKKMDSEGIDSKELPATYKLEATGKLKKAQEAVLIEFYLEYTDRVAIGDKIVYFAANKAVIKDIIPDINAPYTDFRPKEPIDTFVSQVSVDKRIVTSTIITGGLNKMVIELDRSVKDILGIKYDESKI